MKEGMKGWLENGLKFKKHKKLRQHLRNNMTEMEIMMEQIEGKQLLDFKVRRQYGVGNYVIDFYCPKIKLGIEIEGFTFYYKRQAM